MIGRRISGRFTIDAPIGAGAMGEVYAARCDDGREVAIKFLHRAVAQSQSSVDHFAREARIGARIRSPFVAGLVDAGVTSDGAFWIAFERLNGFPLDRFLINSGPLRGELAARLVADLLAGLADAHRVGVVHRDIKPANLFAEHDVASRFLRFRVLDFGIAKVIEGLTGSLAIALTKHDGVLGTLRYMAPEQFAAPDCVDGRCDLYALGCVLFEALSGLPAFPTIANSELVQLKATMEIPTLRETTKAQWPASVDGFIRRLSARDVEARFSSSPDALAHFARVREDFLRLPSIARSRAALPIARTLVD